VAARYDAPRLARARPDVAGALAHIDSDEELRAVYDRYVAEISSWDWAVAWRTALALDALCDSLKPRRILDLGSGFSTYVECRWVQRAQSDTQIVSVDDSPEWLETTRAFLARDGFSCELIARDDLGSLPEQSFDLAFDDMGRIEARADAIDTLVRVMAPGGVVVLDDMNVRGYRADVRARLDRAGWPLYSLRKQTIDQRGRFAMLTAAPRR
jgi:predicted O-methyltransferase YrrM